MLFAPNVLLLLLPHFLAAAAWVLPFHEGNWGVTVGAQMSPPGQCLWGVLAGGVAELIKEPKTTMQM